MKEVYIVAAQRTPMGSFGGVLSGFSATQLGSFAIKGALEKCGLAASEVQEVFMGNVIAAHLGQAPARQAALGAGLGQNVPCTTVNKVCASGAKAVMLAAQSIMSGQNDVVVAGGMESMSNIPYYLPKARNGYRYGHGQLVDGLVFDGLTDAYSGDVMGLCGDACAANEGISREEQDRFAIQSYKRSAHATQEGFFKNEIVPVEVTVPKQAPVMIAEDEEYKKVNFDKVPSLRPVFSKDGTVTAANASTLNDGASALVLMSKEKAEALGIRPIAKIKGFADAALAPELFTIAPTKAAPIALERAGLSMDQIDFFEVNEAFAVVTMAFNKTFGLSEEKVNVFGGAVSLGHPLGNSGSRILVTLINVLHSKGGKYGLAAICNGGGGASAIVLEKC